MVAEEGRQGALGPSRPDLPAQPGVPGTPGPEAGEAGGTGTPGQTLWAGRPDQAPRPSKRPKNREMLRALMGAGSGDVSFPDSWGLGG